MDPYSVLGVSRDADEETIKKAYHELVKKYHPDKYVNTPMAELASEKMKEINQAYDMIMKGSQTAGNTGNTANNGGYNPYGPFGGYGNGNYSAASYQSVRALLNMGRVAEAIRMLNQLPKNAEWYFLYGIACMRRGWYDQALENIQTAVNMDPGNAEYRAALDNIKNRNTAYTGSPHNMTGMRCGVLPCDLCTLCMCANCCTGC